MFVSETFSIEDCLAYFVQSDVASWSTTSTFKISSYTVPTKHKILIKYNTTPNCQFAIGNNNSWLYAWALQSDCVLHRQPNSQVQTTATRNANSVYGIHYDDGSIILYQDDTQVGTASTTDNNYPKNIRLFNASSSTGIEYIKIKPL